MSVVLCAGDERPKSRTAYWQHVVRDAVGPLDLRVSGDVDVCARLRVGDVGAIRVAELSHGHTDTAERSPTHIRQADPELYKIDVLARGRGVVEQDGRQAAKAPGDLVFVDLSRPCRWVYSSAEVVAVAFPRALLPLKQDELGRLTGVRIRGDRGTGALVSSLARQLPEHLGEYGVADQLRVSTAVLDLLTAALAARLDRSQDVPPDSRQRSLLLRMLAFIEVRLGDPRLSPAGIAAAHFISVRYLYKLFETEETTPADWIRRRRLERSRRDLLDPELRHTPAAAIAERWGFASAAQFSRSFRAAYGLPPAEYRTAGLGTLRG
jgi:AraC-like DNA-binding protein